MSQEFLGQLTVVASDRNQRILDAKPRLPGLLWAVRIFQWLVMTGSFAYGLAFHIVRGTVRVSTWPRTTDVLQSHEGTEATPCSG